MNVIAVYAGSFDPITNGHLDLILRGSKVFDKLIVAIGVNSSKKPLFSLEEKTTLIQECIPGTITNVEVASFDGLLVDYCKNVGATVILRGLRAAMDFEYELGITNANAKMAPNIDTFFLTTKPTFSFVSSSTVREIARHNSSSGWDTLDHYVNPVVIQALRKKFGGSP